MPGHARAMDGGKFEAPYNGRENRSPSFLETSINETLYSMASFIFGADACNHRSRAPDHCDHPYGPGVIWRSKRFPIQITTNTTLLLPIAFLRGRLGIRWQTCRARGSVCSCLLCLGGVRTRRELSAVPWSPRGCVGCLRGLVRYRPLGGCE